MSAPRTDRARYPSRRAYVKNARHRAQRVLDDWKLPESVVTDVAYVVNELVSNAITHARVPKGREVGVTIRLLDSVVRVEVRDADHTKPEVQKLPDLILKGDLREAPEHGRGLRIVEALSARWGVTEEVIGKTVWADISLTPEEVIRC